MVGQMAKKSTFSCGQRWDRGSRRSRTFSSILARPAASLQGLPKWRAYWVHWWLKGQTTKTSRIKREMKVCQVFPVATAVSLSRSIQAILKTTHLGKLANYCATGCLWIHLWQRTKSQIINMHTFGITNWEIPIGAWPHDENKQFKTFKIKTSVSLYNTVVGSD